MPLPSIDFDPTEASVPWKLLTEHKVDVVFATPNGLEASCDNIMLTGRGLGLLTSLLCANKDGREAYYAMFDSAAFKSPIKWEELKEEDYDGIILPGGHAKGMRDYLESAKLQKVIVDFFKTKKPIGAICHGVLLVARSIKEDGKSVLYGRKTTALAGMQEMLAWLLTCLWMKDYYRTYPQTVEKEVKSYLASPKDFLHGSLPFFRDDPNHISSGFTVCDQNYLSARWPGDAHRFAMKYLQLLQTGKCE